MVYCAELVVIYATEEGAISWDGGPCQIKVPVEMTKRYQFVLWYGAWKTTCQEAIRLI